MEEGYFSLPYFRKDKIRLSIFILILLIFDLNLSIITDAHSYHNHHCSCKSKPCCCESKIKICLLGNMLQRKEKPEEKALILNLSCGDFSKQLSLPHQGRLFIPSREIILPLNNVWHYLGNLPWRSIQQIYLSPPHKPPPLY